MSSSAQLRALLLSLVVAGSGTAALAEQAAQAPAAPQPSAVGTAGRSVRVVGVIRDENNAIPLPGIPVELVGTDQVVYTDVDGRYVLDVPAGTHEIKVAIEGYQPKTLKVEANGQRDVTVDVGLQMAGFAETVDVTANVIDAETSSAEAQLLERKNAQVIADNLSATEMRANADSDAAAAMARITGLSVVDNQYVFVRGLGERYSNTTLAGALIPTTEPDKKVVPLDMFPSGLLDSVQVAKSYSPDRSAEFAGGLVQIVPLKLPNRPLFDVGYGLTYYSTATGESIPLSPIGSRDWLGFDAGARELPASFPSSKIIRQGIYTPSVGFTADQITAFGRELAGVAWRPVSEDGTPGQNWSVVLGNRFGNLGVVASGTHSYKETYIDEVRRFFRIGDAGTTDLDAVSDYEIQTGTQRAQLGIVGNVAYQFSPTQRFFFENFYTHTGRDEGRIFQGANTDNARLYRNYRLQFIEEGLLSNAFGGEHFFQNLGNSRIDWRASFARATRDEPDLREVLYEAPLTATNPSFVLADESQSGFRMFNMLDDDTVDVAANWSMFDVSGGRPTQYKFGANYVARNREFQSRRFRYIPVVLNKDGSPAATFAQSPEELYTPANIGTVFRFNEETRPTDAYDGGQNTTAAYGMVDLAFTSSTRLIAGARVERSEQEVNTFDPFGLFQRTVTSAIEKTDFFPSVNFVQALRSNMNLRLSYATTVNRPEFRELAPFEFTDVIGSRAVRGNPDLERALIQNVDARWEVFTGRRGVLAASTFFKRFDSPIERVVVAGATPLVTFQNADVARNFGFELEAGVDVLPGLFVNANYTFVDSTIELRPEQRTVQTSLERPLAGQSENLFNLMAEYSVGGFSSRVLFNYCGDRISDVGANEAPDIIEQGRGSLDLVFSQRLGGLALRLAIENLTDSEHLFTQRNDAQRLFSLGRTIGFSIGYDIF